MPPKKQALKNGFFCFCIEFREDQEQMGREMPRSMKELMAVASGHWNKLSRDQKEVYNRQAKALNGQRDKMNCAGQLIKDVEREKQEAQAKEDAMIRFIYDHVRSFGTIKEASRGTYFIISFNIFCKTINNMYLPAEVGLVEFNLEHGILNSYHTFIDPLEIPTGYTYQCKEKSELTHKIPWLNFELAEKDYTKIGRDIIDFITPEDNRHFYPPLYCHMTEMEHAKALIDVFMKDLPRTVDLQVYDVAHLFYELYSFAKQDMISVGLIRDYLNSSAYSYTENTSCQWHWDNDCVEHCSLGIAKRSCFIMFDYLCPLYNIRPIPNKHMPACKQLQMSTLSDDRNASAASFRSDSTLSRSHSQSNRDRNYDTDSSAHTDRSRSSRQYASRDSEISWQTPGHSTRFISECSDSDESSYYVPCASPQNTSASFDQGRSGWNSAREPSTQSYSAAAASRSGHHSNDFRMSDSNFPSLEERGGARQKQPRQRLDSSNNARHQHSRRAPSPNSSSASSASYQRGNYGNGCGRGLRQREY